MLILAPFNSIGLSMLFAGSLVALVTPMLPSGQVDWPAWQSLIDWHLAVGTNGLVVLGSTGEAATLTETEQDQLLRTAVQQVAGRAPLIVGAGTQATASTIDRVRWAKSAGADAALVVTPFYNRPTQEGLYLHYEAIVRAVDLPIMLYNVPGRTGCDLLPETVHRLARLRGVVAIKEAVPDPGRIQALLQAPGLQVLSGDDGSACESVLSGAHGVVSVAANVAPEWMRRLMKLSTDGRCDANTARTARLLNDDLCPLFDALGICTNPIPVKWALHAMGCIQAGIRLPLTVLSEPMRAAVEAALAPLDDK